MEIRMKKQETDQKSTPGKIALTVVFAVISVIWMMPIIIVPASWFSPSSLCSASLFFTFSFLKFLMLYLCSIFLSVAGLYTW